MFSVWQAILFLGLAINGCKTRQSESIGVEKDVFLSYQSGKNLVIFADGDTVFLRECHQYNGSMPRNCEGENLKTINADSFAEALARNFDVDGYGPNDGGVLRIKEELDDLELKISSAAPNERASLEMIQTKLKGKQTRVQTCDDIWKSLAAGANLHFFEGTQTFEFLVDVFNNSKYTCRRTCYCDAGRASLYLPSLEVVTASGFTRASAIQKLWALCQALPCPSPYEGRPRAFYDGEPATCSVTESGS